MIWRPRHLTRSQFEERRLEGGRLLQAGQLSQKEYLAEHPEIEGEGFLKALTACRLLEYVRGRGVHSSG